MCARKHYNKDLIGFILFWQLKKIMDNYYVWFFFPYRHIHALLNQTDLSECSLHCLVLKKMNNKYTNHT